MSKMQILETPEWRKFRDKIWERDQGKCRLCGGEGRDVHYNTMKYGPFEPREVFVICRYCQEVWWGFPPDHLPDDHKDKAVLTEMARLARNLPKKFRAWYW